LALSSTSFLASFDITDKTQEYDISPVLLAALFLLAWSGLLLGVLRRGQKVALEIVLRRQHYLQACQQGAVILYWGYYWREVYHAAPLIAAQLLFAYGFDSLLSYIIFAANEETRAARMRAGLGVADDSNLRIIRVKLGYHAEARLLAKAADGSIVVRSGLVTREHMFNAAEFMRSLDHLQASVLPRRRIDCDIGACQKREQYPVLIPVPVVLVPGPRPADFRVLQDHLRVVVVHLPA
jgi:hypothetical protein